MTNDQQKQLLAPFEASEILWRLSHSNETGGFAVPYIDSRSIQKRLDQVLGRENWQNDFITIPSTNPKETAAHICRIGLYYEVRKEWIFKSDGAGSTEFEPVKGGLSDAFKRAASMWGIGRYLYGFDGVWVDIETNNKKKSIPKKEIPKLNKAYAEMLAKAFPMLTKTQGNPNSGQQTKPTQQNQSQSSQQNKPQQPKLINLYSVKSAQITKGSQGENTYVQLVCPDGKPMNGYIQGNVGLKGGQKLSNLQFTVKDGPQGEYTIINNYQIAA